MTAIYQPETRTLKQIKRDYHRSLHPPLRQRFKVATARVGSTIARGMVYLLAAVVISLAAIVAAFFLHAVFAPLLVGLSVPVLLLLLLLK